MRRLLSLLLALGLSTAASAQQAAPGDTARPDPFRRLALPTPNRIRTGSGMPGPEYWQQRADYRITATLDTARRVLSGQELLTYTNNSPDTLRYLWLQLDQNLFNSRSRGAQLYPQDSRWGTGGAEGGVTLQRVALAAVPAAKGRRAAPRQPLQFWVNGTVMKVILPRPLPPKGRITLDLAWSFPFGFNSNRMGLEQIDGDLIYEVAQWYPRMAVYDDVRGWNTEQYLGMGEFYLEYGSFDVRLTVPASMLVAATGVLRNPETVLTAEQRSRLARARRSDSTVAIRGLKEIGPGSRPASRDGMLTWHFTADSVRDFAWAAAPHFIWDAVGVNGGRTLAMSFYPPSADSIWNRSSEYAKLAIERYSRRWMPYPYPVAINVNGIEGGMEYPMIVFCHNRTDGPALYSVTDHEFGHTWFPMIVGSNERLYPWMDEGFNTFQNYYNWEEQYPGQFNRRANIRSYLQYAAHETQPVMTAADRTAPQALGQVAYNKPGLMLRLLRDQVIGGEHFDQAMREYIRRWAYKHPTPADFFRTIEDAVGEDLSWYWREWLYTTARLDQAVDSVSVAEDGGKTVSRVFLRNAGDMVMPVSLRLTTAAGADSSLTLPVEVWYGGDRHTLQLRGVTITGVQLDPDSLLPDVSRANNQWPRAGGPDSGNH